MAAVAVPDFQTVMRPVLVALAEGNDLSSSAIRSAVAQHFSLSQAELDEKIPSGRAKTFANRIGWALTYMYRALLIERPKRSTYRITHRGRAVLEQHPKRVDLKVLSQFEEFVAFKTSKPLDGTVIAPAAPTVVAATAPAASEQTPEEQIDAAHEEMRTALAAEVIDRVRERSPDLFEQLVLDVRVAWGTAARWRTRGSI